METILQTSMAAQSMPLSTLHHSLLFSCASILPECHFIIFPFKNSSGSMCISMNLSFQMGWQILSVKKHFLEMSQAQLWHQTNATQHGVDCLQSHAQTFAFTPWSFWTQTNKTPQQHKVVKKDLGASKQVFCQHHNFACKVLRQLSFLFHVFWFFFVKQRPMYLD